MISFFSSEGFRIFYKAWLYVTVALSVYVVLRGAVIFLTIVSTRTKSLNDFFTEMGIAYVALLIFGFFLFTGIRSFKAKRLVFSFPLKDVAFVVLSPIIWFLGFYSVWDSYDKTMFWVLLSMIVAAGVLYVLRRFSLSRKDLINL